MTEDTEFEMVLCTKIGRFCRTKVIADSPKDALMDVFWAIGGDGWRLAFDRDRTYVLIQWTATGRDGRRIRYCKSYTCRALREFDDLPGADVDDLINSLIGMRYVFTAYDYTDERFVDGELYTEVSYDLEKRYRLNILTPDRHDIRFIPRWIHRHYDDEYRKEWLEDHDMTKEN